MFLTDVFEEFSTLVDTEYSWYLLTDKPRSLMHQNSKQWRKTICHLYWSMQLQRPLVVKKEMIEIHHLHSFIFVMPTFKPHFEIIEITKHKFCINQYPSYPRQYPLPLHYHCPHFPPQHNWSQYFLPQLLVAGQASHRTRKQHRLHSTPQGLSSLLSCLSFGHLASVF